MTIKVRLVKSSRAMYGLCQNKPEEPLLDVLNAENKLKLLKLLVGVIYYVIWLSPPITLLGCSLFSSSFSIFSILVFIALITGFISKKVSIFVKNKICRSYIKVALFHLFRSKYALKKYEQTFTLD
jgi:hypothetical protein